MNSTGWTNFDDRQLQELAMQPSMVLDTTTQKQFDEVFNSYYYGELPMTQVEIEAEKRWQELTGGGNE